MNPGEGWLLLQNSWGTEWGDGGYGKISYGDFSRRCVEAGALVVPRRHGLFAVFSVAAALIAGGIALFAALSGDRLTAGPDWWTDAPWTNGTLNICADISKGAYETCPLQMRYRLFGQSTNALPATVGRCLFGVETLDLKSTQVLLLFARSPHDNYSAKQKQVINAFLKDGGMVMVFLCDCNFACMGDLLASYGLRLHRLNGKDSLVGTIPETRRFDIEGSALVSGEAVEGGWTSLVATDGVHPHSVTGCRRVGKGVMAYVSQRMFGTRYNRDMNVDFWQAVLTAAVRASGRFVKGPVADQSANKAPVQVRVGRALVCASEVLRPEVQIWSKRFASTATNDVRVLLCDSSVQDKSLCGKPVFRHYGAFHKDSPPSLAK